MANWSSVIFAALAIVPLLCSGDTCLSPSVQSKVHTSTDATVAQDTAIVVQVAVTCKNGLRDQNLYAELNGQAIPASKIQAGGDYQYQVSFSGDHKALPAGSYSVRFFDEEGYSILRKAQRSGEDISAVKSLFDVEVNHPGTSKGMFVQSEFIAAVLSVFLWYFAHTTRNKLQAN